jgi:hypothetical protein
VTDIWDAEQWPLEAAVAWVLYGDKRLFAEVAAIAFQRRSDPSLKLATLANRLLIYQGQAAVLEAVDGSLYRKEMRKGWTTGIVSANGAHPITQGIKRVAKVMVGRPATGCPGAAQRMPIPEDLWKSAAIVDHRQSGLILRVAGEPIGATWRYIDVTAAPFQLEFRAKRGRRPAGIGDGARLPRKGKKTKQRLRTQQKQRAEGWGTPIPPAKPRPGRPKGSKNVPH